MSATEILMDVQAATATYVLNRDGTIVHLATCRRIGKHSMPAHWYDGRPIDFFCNPDLSRRRLQPQPEPLPGTASNRGGSVSHGEGEGGAKL